MQIVWVVFGGGSSCGMIEQKTSWPALASDSRIEVKAQAG